MRGTKKARYAEYTGKKCGSWSTLNSANAGRVRLARRRL